MIRIFILLSLGLQVTCGCLAMDPGDHISCPSVPQKPALQMPDWEEGYTSVDLKGPIIKNGDLVYTCDPPTIMTSYEGSENETLSDGETLTCKSNSGLFVLKDNKDVNPKKFNCRGELRSCEYFGELQLGPLTADLYIVFPDEGYNQGFATYTCAGEHNRQYVATNKDPANAKPLGEGSKISCNVFTGKVTYFDGKIEMTITDDLLFGCAQPNCWACDRNRIFDEKFAFCAGHPVIDCKSKPIVKDNASNCPVISCSGTDILFKMSSRMATPVDAAKISCGLPNTDWMYEDVELNFGEGFVCGTLKGSG